MEDAREKLMKLNPRQLEIISHEYYAKGVVVGRDILYDHLKRFHPNVFDSRDAIGDWLKHQEVNQLFQKQKKPKVVSSFVPISPFHSLSLDLIDKTNTPGLILNSKNMVVGKYTFILIIVDNFSRYMWAYPLKRKTTEVAAEAIRDFFNDLQTNWFLPPRTIKYIQMDNGSEFKKEFMQAIRNEGIKINKTIPYMPQSNSIVERSNGIIKRIINKLIYIHDDKRYYKWADYLDQAVQIYNSTINSSTKRTPNSAIMMNHVDEFNEIISNVKEKSLKPAPFQSNYALGQKVRLRIPKGKLDKFDKPNWSDEIYIISHVKAQNTQSINSSMPKATRYMISEINEDGYPGRESPILYVKESLLAVPPILVPPKPPKAPRVRPRRELEGYTINIPSEAEVQHANMLLQPNQNQPQNIDYGSLTNLLYQHRKPPEPEQVDEEDEWAAAEKEYRLQREKERDSY